MQVQIKSACTSETVEIPSFGHQANLFNMTFLDFNPEAILA